MSDQPETLAAILAEMRDERIIRLDGADVTRCLLRNLADRIEAAVQRFVADDCAKCAHYHAATISLKDALDLANTIANHGINANDLADKASATIYALCHEVRTVREEDANIKQEVQKLRRELRDLRRAPGNSAAMRKALESVEGNIAEDEPGRFWLQDPEAILHEVQAALAAPARNCDRFANWHDAMREEYFTRSTPENVKGYPYGDDKRWREFCDWLFAKAEGGDHA